jgi:hypothetical protein
MDHKKAGKIVQALKDIDYLLQKCVSTMQACTDAIEYQDLEQDLRELCLEKADLELEICAEIQKNG